MYRRPVTNDPTELLDWQSFSNVVLLRGEFKASDKFLKLEEILKHFLSTTLNHFHPKRYRFMPKKRERRKGLVFPHLTNKNKSSQSGSI